jgi:ATP-dependent RNA helicase DDX19/DBP5
MADKAASPEKKSWADVEEEEEEAKAKAAAEAEAAAAAAASSSSSTVPAVEEQAKQIEALSLAPAVEDAAGEEGPPLLDDSDDSQIQAVRSRSPSSLPPALTLALAPSQPRLPRAAD